MHGNGCLERGMGRERMTDRRLDPEQSRFLDHAWHEFEEELWRYLRRRVRDSGAREDIFQLTWERMGRSGYLIYRQPPYCVDGRWASFDDPELRRAIWGILALHARRAIASYFRALPTESSLEQMMDEGFEPSIPRANPTESRIRLELSRLGFSEQEISVVVLHTLGALTIREIAERTGLSKSTVDRMIDRVESKLCDAGEEGDD